MTSIRGQDGEMKMFREGNMATVYTWKQSTGCWERVGEVVGAAKQSTHYEGDAVRLKCRKTAHACTENIENRSASSTSAASSQPPSRSAEMKSRVSAAAELRSREICLSILEHLKSYERS
uniref:PFU (PLAA family ubiquitin-binding) protein n=1 Tax=Toxoplasma gondii TgCATBr9 TaxID=943120 RepID=A0A2T6IXF6_TOXGO|nr:PFU (PLAA family ubiquitin-binding) protein [Toxoplasma gondii TgCATBr9]